MDDGRRSARATLPFVRCRKTVIGFWIFHGVLLPFQIGSRVLLEAFSQERDRLSVEVQVPQERLVAHSVFVEVVSDFCLCVLHYLHFLLLPWEDDPYEKGTAQKRHLEKVTCRSVDQEFCETSAMSYPRYHPAMTGSPHQVLVHSSKATCERGCKYTRNRSCSH